VTPAPDGFSARPATDDIDPYERAGMRPGRSWLFSEQRIDSD
jgi:hypothetical protein